MHMAQLTVIAGTDVGATFELTQNSTTLGRNPECDIVVDSAAVSRTHAKITRDKEGWLLEDLGSRNGTFVNEMRLTTRRRLLDADHIRICDVIFQFRAQAADVRSSVTIDDDDEEERRSAIMTKFDVTHGSTVTQFGASAEVKLNALVALTKNIGKSISLDDVLPSVLDSLFRIFVQADRGFIVLRGSDGKLMPRWSKFRRGDQASARISRSILKHVVETREAILSADATDDSRFLMSESIANLSIRSLMCAPLIDAEGNVLGAIQIDTLDQRSRFRDPDLEVLAAVAAQAAIAINNARLYDEALQQRAIQRDLELAKRVQASLLPAKRPTFRGFEFYDYYQAANLIGGDYFDYVELPNGRLAVIVADVSGHGIASALLMARMSAEARFCLATIDRPGEVVGRLNQMMCDDQWDDGFVTLVLAVLRPDSGKLTLVIAGHSPPLVRGVDGQVKEIGGDVAGLPLGVAGGMTYDEAHYTLEPGELLLAYTDGIPESMDSTHKAYGNQRIKTLLGEGPSDAAQFGQALLRDVRNFVGDASQGDDMCVVCLKRGT